MKHFNNDKVRRQDRLLNEERANYLLENGEFGVLSMITPEHKAYGIPLNYVWNRDESIYIHCAPNGRKLECIAYCSDVSFTIIGQTSIKPEKFTTNYESIVLTCKAYTNLPETERNQALKLFISKYSPHLQELGLSYAEKSFHRTEIIRLDIINVSGKSKNIK